MAKRGVLEHEKTIMLADVLGIMEPFALGVLEAFWQWVAKYRPTGDLTGARPSLMARSIRYTADPQILWDALIEAGFIDIDGDRATVHDWSDHADDSVHMRLARAVQRFADGTVPNLHRLSLKERQEIEAAFVRTASAQEAQGERTESALPLPLPLPMPKPMPSQSPAHAVGGEGLAVNEQEIIDQAKVVAIRVRCEAPLSGLPVELAVERSALHEIRLGKAVEEVVNAMLDAWRTYLQSRPKLHKPWGAEKFFGEGYWKDSTGWPWLKGHSPPPAQRPPAANTRTPQEQAYFDRLEKESA